MPERLVLSGVVNGFDGDRGGRISEPKPPCFVKNGKNLNLTGKSDFALAA